MSMFHRFPVHSGSLTGWCPANTRSIACTVSRSVVSSPGLSAISAVAGCPPTTSSSTYSYGLGAVKAGVPLTTIASVPGRTVGIVLPGLWGEEVRQPDVSTTAIYTSALGSEQRELVSRVWG